MATGGASETGGVSDIERGTDETFDNLCSPCSRRNKNTEGSKYCIDCEDYFCSTCVNWHNDFPALRNHKILDKASLSLMKVKKYSVSEIYDTDIGCFIESVCELDDGTIILSFIESVCELDDGTIILSDGTFFRNKLMRLDSSSYMVRDSCIVPQSPHQVCTISSQEVAVCCNWAQLIQFVSIGLTMQTTRQIKTGFCCSGLAYNDEKLFVSDDNSSVYVYTLTGERLQQFNKPGLFSSLFRGMTFGYIITKIAVSSDDSTIYIVHRHKGLIILNRSGQLVGEFTDPKLTGATDVCLYKNNSVLVCGRDSNNVLQFTPDGKLIGEVLKRDKGCYALCYCKKTSKLIVGYWREIEVYDINE